MIVYCSSDCSSAHTIKRIEFLKRRGFVVRVFGIRNLSNDDFIVSEEFRTTRNDDSFKYVQRIIVAFRIVLSMSFVKREFIILRGFEFLFWRFLLFGKVYYELTDLPEIFCNNALGRFLIKLSLRNVYVLSTSQGFIDVLNLKNYSLWHNVPIVNYGAIDIRNKKKNRIIYAGYLRGIGILKEENELLFREMDFFGRLNILNSGHDKIPDKRYFGPYDFLSLSDLYSSYKFGYISDYYGCNSHFNTTNRLYEVILSGAIPVHIKNDSMHSFLKKLGVVFVYNHDEFKKLSIISELELNEIVKANFLKLMAYVDKDNERLVDFLVSPRSKDCSL